MLSSRELSLYENVLHMSLCIVGDRFQLYQGKREGELMTVVNYIDENTGEIFNTINSREIEQAAASDPLVFGLAHRKPLSIFFLKPPRSRTGKHSGTYAPGWIPDMH